MWLCFESVFLGSLLRFASNESPKEGHFESLVRCHRRMTFAEAEELITSKSSEAATVLLQQLNTLSEQFERTAFEKGHSFPFEHWEPELGLDLPVAGFLKSKRIVDCLAFLVNFYAAQVLDRQSLWREFLSFADSTSDFMPAFVYGVADVQHHRSLQRLLQHNPETMSVTGASTTEVVEALRRILGQEPSCETVNRQTEL